MKKLIVPCLSLSFLLLAGCGILKPYQPDVQQGNVVSEADVAKLKPGMSKDQVSNLLGTPVLDNAFNTNHWAYVYTFQHDGGVITKKNLDVYFNNNRVTRIVNGD
jgi:outer membrane protein assembly factor BamE